MATLIPGANNEAELYAELQKIDISVPGLAEGRTTKHTEIWTICRLLSSLAHAGKLTYPLTVSHTDKPDFFAYLGDAKIGIEVTEATSQNYAECRALAAREFPDAIIDLGLFRPGKPKLSAVEIRKALSEKRLRSEGWGGNSVEHEWAWYIQERVDEKLIKLPRYNTHGCQETWLSIYSNTPSPNIHQEEALAILFPLLSDYWSLSPAFAAIFIEYGQTIIRITDEGWEKFALHNLWRPSGPAVETIENFEDDVTDEELWNKIMHQPSPTKCQKKF
ncbi:MAG: hypothetical protein AB7U61_00555 [Methylocystis sp.]